jgi:hypothetical protein
MIALPASSRERTSEDRPATVAALVVLSSAWLWSFVVYANVFADAIAAGPPDIPLNPLGALFVITVVATEPISLALSFLLLGALLFLTGLWLPPRDRATLGLLAAAWIATVVVAIGGIGQTALNTRTLAPLFAALISVGGLRILITAALRRRYAGGSAQPSNERWS